MKAHLRYIRISPRKMQLVARLIQGLPVAQAEIQLVHSPKKAARSLLKLLHSSATNAHHNFGVDKDGLRVKEVLVNQGPTFRRFRPRARGRAYPIKKRTSHVSITLETIDSRVAPQPKKQSLSKAVVTSGKKSVFPKPKTVRPRKTPPRNLEPQPTRPGLRRFFQRKAV